MAAAQFWFDFASTYSYLAIMRAEGLAAARGVALTWRPFLLGPIFAQQGWNTSPFLTYPAKGQFMWRDVARRAAAYGLPFEPEPPVFPARSVDACRMAIAALETPQGPAFCRAVTSALWAQARDIAEPEVLADCAAAVGLDNDRLAARAIELKPALRANTEAAMAAGVFGAPSVTVGEELFWGDDQLEDAFSWAVEGRLTPRIGLT